MKLPNYEEDDAEIIHNENPDTYWIPSKEDKDSLKKGDLVKLVLRMELTEDRNEVSVERMWVEIQDKNSEYYQDILDNDPGSDVFLKCGESIIFEAKHVIQIYDE